jgi:hypothetical protein
MDVNFHLVYEFIKLIDNSPMFSDEHKTKNSYMNEAIPKMWDLVLWSQDDAGNGDYIYNLLGDKHDEIYFNQPDRYDELWNRTTEASVARAVAWAVVDLINGGPEWFAVAGEERLTEVNSATWAYFEKYVLTAETNANAG